MQMMETAPMASECKRRGWFARLENGCPLWRETQQTASNENSALNRFCCLGRFMSAEQLRKLLHGGIHAHIRH